MSGRAADPAKQLAIIALSGGSDVAMLEEAMSFCWDQLGRRWTDAEMDALAARLGLQLIPEGPEATS